MAINKVVFGNETLIDLTTDTADESKVASGYKFHKANGAQATGTYVPPEPVNVQPSKAVTVPANTINWNFDTVEVLPDSGYDAMAKVDATANVSWLNGYFGGDSAKTSQVCFGGEHNGVFEGDFDTPSSTGNKYAVSKVSMGTRTIVDNAPGLPSGVEAAQSKHLPKGYAAIYYGQGSLLTGKMPNYGPGKPDGIKNIVISSKSPISIPEGAYSTTANQISLDSTSRNNLIESNIKSGVSILGVTGTYQGSGGSGGSGGSANLLTNAFPPCTFYGDYFQIGGWWYAEESEGYDGAQNVDFYMQGMPVFIPEQWGVPAHIDVYFLNMSEYDGPQLFYETLWDTSWLEWADPEGNINSPSAPAEFASFCSGEELPVYNIYMNEDFLLASWMPPVADEARGSASFLNLDRLDTGCWTPAPPRASINPMTGEWSLRHIIAGGDGEMGGSYLPPELPSGKSYITSEYMPDNMCALTNDGQGIITGTLPVYTNVHTIEIGDLDPWWFNAVFKNAMVRIDPQEAAKIIPENIRSGVRILGVNGSYKGAGNPVLSTLTVTPSTSAQTETPSSPAVGFSQVNVLPIPRTDVANNGGTWVQIG